MLKQIIGVLTLDSGTFQEIEHDKSATSKALLVVIVASILAAIGGGFGTATFGIGIGITENTTFKALSIAVWAIFAWLMWSLVTYLLGTKLFHGKATFGELARVIGFAYAPLAFQIFTFVPLFGLIVPWLVAFWAVAAVLIGVKEALDFDYGRTWATILIGFFIYLLGMGVLLYIF